MIIKGKKVEEARKRFISLDRRVGFSSACRRVGLTRGQGQSFKRGKNPNEATWKSIRRWLERGSAPKGDFPGDVEDAIRAILKYGRKARTFAKGMERLYAVHTKVFRSFKPTK